MSENKRAKFGRELDFAAAEAYNLLRTNVTFAAPVKRRGRIIGLTSANPQEGKSYTSTNLAYSIAESQKRVLLVEADLRKPVMEDNLQKDLPLGLSDVLISEEEGVSTKYIHQINEYLSVLSAGSIPPNPSELLGSQTMKALLREYAKSYDFIIVDLPPVNTVSDGLVISQYLDGMIVVVRHGSTRRRDVKEAIRQLELVKANILGFVYNSYHKTGGAYYKKKYYRKNYGYGSYADGYKKQYEKQQQEEKKED